MRLVAMAAAELGQLHRQVAIAGDALLEDQHMRRAIHRLERHQIARPGKYRLIVLDTLFADMRNLIRNDEHILAILAPVAALLPLLRIHQLRRLDLGIARRVEPAAHIGLQLAPQDEALGMPEHRAMRLGLEVEQVHFLPDLAMVALGRFLQPHEMLGELLLVEPSRPVNPAEHRVGLVAAPISPRHPRQLERLRIKLAGRGQMRPAAQVHPRRLALAAAIHGDRLALGKLHHPLGLEAFARANEVIANVAAAPFLADQWLVGGDNAAHLGLDQREVLVGEHARAPRPARNHSKSRHRSPARR